MIRPLKVSATSAFIDQQCALCKEHFVAGDEIVICPEDGARHHAQCWEANGNKCSAFGCTGNGRLQSASAPIPPGNGRPRVIDAPTAEEEPRSKVRVLPSSSLGCAQTCLLLSIAVVILIMAFSCFGLWAIADYILVDVLGWHYRAPLTGMILPQLLLLWQIRP
ncbi:MAG: hypothetical protein H6659_04595 [Ardenticatenaceae bacterium]|nr:hypothetical protein [Ardenticatenaceae bacterium]MCB8988409.1 hypothetical protein [Ardenticatenaceae bacterium]